MIIACVLPATLATHTASAEGASLAAFEGPFDSGRVALYRPSPSKDALQRAGVEPASLSPYPIEGWWLAEVVATSPPSSIEATIRRIAATGAADFVSPALRDGFDEPLILTPFVLVRFRPGVSEETMGGVLQEHGLTSAGRPVWDGLPRARRVRTTGRDGLEVLRVVRDLAADPRVEYAEPDAMFSGKGAITPNDPGFPMCWGLHNTGQGGGIPDVDMDAPEAWDTTFGDSGCVVVIIDVGVQQDHPDLHAAPGTDLTGQGGSGWPVNPCDNHGTAVAGCVSAIANNGLGTVGVAPNVRVASARTFISNPTCDNTWTSTASWTVDALAWARFIGARVTNNSNSYGFRSRFIEDAYAETRALGMVHFASAGNDLQSAPAYPASVKDVNAVGAIDRTGSLAPFSNHGSGIAFVAPGVDVYTTDRSEEGGWDPGDHVLVSGTSYSSSYAAGVAGLVVSEEPHLSAMDVEGRMQWAATDLGSPGYDSTFGWGLVNARRSVGDGDPECLANPLVGLCDTFAGSAFDTGRWDLSRNSSGATVLVENGLVLLHSGTTGGGGCLLHSDIAFTNSGPPLRFEGRCRVDALTAGALDHAGWGLFLPPGYNFAMFEVNPTLGFRGSIRESGHTPLALPIGGVDCTSWHVYRIDVWVDRVEFFVDGVLRASYSGTESPGEHSLKAHLDRTSPGQDKILYVDWVRVLYGSGGTVAAPILGGEPAPVITVCPNPLTRGGMLALRLGVAGMWEYSVFDVRGARVVGPFRGDGPQIRSWDARAQGRPVPAGTYFVRTTAGERTDVRKVTIVK